MQNIIISTELKSYLIKNFKQFAESWLQNAVNTIDECQIKWGLTNIIQNPQSRFGLVFYAQSIKYGDVVLKLIPRFSFRLQYEIEGYIMLNQQFMCPMLDYDCSLDAILLKRVMPGKNLMSIKNVDLRFAAATSFFNEVLQNINLQQHHDFIPNYKNVMNQNFNKVFTCSEKMPYIESIIDLIYVARTQYEQYFENEDQYYLHGDLHHLNIISSESRFYAIDPISVIGYPAFELARFCEDELYHSVNIKYTLQKIHLFADKYDISKEQIDNAIFIDFVLRLGNTLFEGDKLNDILHKLLFAHTLKKSLMI